MSQTTYSITADDAIQGMLGDDGANRKSLSLANEEATAVEYGRPVVEGTDGEKQFLLPSSAGENFMGITIHQHDREDLDADGIVEGEIAEVLRSGRIWVKVFEAIALGDDVYYQHTANAGAVPGDWRNDADTANADQLVQAQWLTAAGAGELALLEVNYP
jgi:hypothetical protein